MSGYNGFSMSNNAVSAYENGLKPYSKWTKCDILDCLSVDSCTVEKLRKYSTQTLKDYFLQSQAINYSLNSNNMDDISAINEYSEYFERYGTKYDLLDEFRENAIC